MTQFSPSGLSTYETCPLKYWFGYKQKAIKGKKEEPVFFFLGTVVHEVLEKLHKDLNHEKQNSLQDLLDYLNTLWAKTWNANIVIYGDYSEENYKQLAIRMITEYYERYKPFSQARTYGTEVHARAKLELGILKSLQMCNCY
jgi:ATP-dependent helicase/DNAse subunit B